MLHVDVLTCQVYLLSRTSTTENPLKRKYNEYYISPTITLQLCRQMLFYLFFINWSGNLMATDVPRQMSSYRFPECIYVLLCLFIKLY